MVTTGFPAFVAQVQQRIQQQLDNCLPAVEGPAKKLYEAMRYSVLNGGKRIRPMLAYAAAHATGEINQTTDQVAAAVELIHAYSLIHDDLPAMDDDDLRRGKPTCHIAFDEGTAVLAGDALQSLAFELLSLLQGISAETSLLLVRTLSRAAGAQGMVAGQATDIDSVSQQLTIEDLTHMHRQKTGALISVSITMGALATERADQQQLAALDQYGQALGLAFQVQDDILDVTGDTSTLGKQQGADQSLNKPTFVSLLGLQRAKDTLSDLHQQSLSALRDFDQRGDHLRAIADYIINRNH